MVKLYQQKITLKKQKTNLFLQFLELCTGKERYIPEITWSGQSWVHNIFRVWELIFGCEYKIQLQISSSFNGHTVVEYAHTFEGACALFETSIRKYIQNFKKEGIKIPIRVYIPMFTTPQGFQIPSSPYLFAVAYDTSSKTSGFQHSGSNPTWSHTCTGTNLLLTVDALDQYSGACTGITYNSVSLTSIGATSTANQNANSRYLVAPATGSNTVSVSYTTGGQHMWACAKSYTGVSQGSPIDASATKNSLTGATIIATVTVVAANCWVSAGCIIGNGSISTPTITSDKTTRQSDADGNHYMAAASADTNGTVSTGSNSITFTEAGASEGCAVIYSIAVVTSTNWTQTLTETLVDTDTIAKTDTRTLSEVLTDIDTLLKAPQRVLSEVLTTTASMLRTMTRIFTETLVMVATSIQQAMRTLSEVLTTTDVFASLKVKAFTYTEVTTLLDTFVKLIQRTLTETLVMVDTINRVANRLLSEVVSLTDTFIGGLYHYLTLTEIVSLTDVIARLEQRILTETTTLTATLVTLRIKVGTFTETITNTDTILRVITHVMTETISLLDTLIKVLARVAFTETITLTATCLKLGQRIFTETISLTATALNQANHILTEAISLADQLIMRLNGIVTNLWGKVARTIDSWTKQDRN